jgi:UTP--glucose-1-phosphate uridylyltransferase
MNRVRKGIIPAAGLGTRLYPVAGTQAKEMLPVGGKPMIYYAISEAANAGLEELYIVISEGKQSLRRYVEEGGFERDARAEAQGEAVSRLQITFVDQPEPRGSGEAIYRTREFIEGDPFAVLMPDRLLLGADRALSQMLPAYERLQNDLLGVLIVGSQEAAGFGNVGILKATKLKRGLFEVHGFSAKCRDPLVVPEGKTILKYAGRCIVGAHLFSYLERTKRGQEEWDDTPALQAMCEEKRVIGKVLSGRGFDVGNPAGYRGAHEWLG